MHHGINITYVLSIYVISSDSKITLAVALHAIFNGQPFMI